LQSPSFAHETTGSVKRLAHSDVLDCLSAAIRTKQDTPLQEEMASPAMPTLFRFLATLMVLAGLVYGAMFALATFVEPSKGEMSVRVPLEQLVK
jgi:hypothetical protein